MTLAPFLPWLATATAAIAALSLLGPGAIVVLLTDAWSVATLLAAAAGLGVWPATMLLGRDAGIGRRVLLAAGLGLALLGNAALALGALGAMNAVVAWSLVAAGICAGSAFLSLARSADGRAAPHGVTIVAEAPRSTDGVCAPLATAGRSILALPLAAPIAVALLGASLPPGLLWESEARGYDALEYHLQAPREYFDAGRIAFLPHNVYASFPQQVEILTYLLMHLHGDPYDAAIPAQVLHATLGALAVAAVACWLPAGAPRWIGLLLAGACPWLAYVGCLAYVENGVLLFAALAGGLILDDLRSASSTPPFASNPGEPGGAQIPSRRAPPRVALAAGLCAGLAGACKYTAIGMVALPLAIAWGLTMRAAPAARLRRVAAFLVTAVAAMSPWLARNALFTGNPVYPFAYRVFGGSAWSDEQAVQWRRGHALPPDDASIAGRLRIAARELAGVERDDGGWRVSRSLFGAPLLLAALLAGASAALGGGRSRGAAGCALWAALAFAAWAGATHMPGRFATPLIVPLALLAGAACDRRSGTPAAPRGGRASSAPGGRVVCAGLLAVAFVGAFANAATLLERWRGDALRWRARTNVPLSRMAGHTAILRDANPVNAGTPRESLVWLVGDAAVFYIDRRIHYTVVFNRDPWIEYARRSDDPADCVRWLRERGVTHVALAWSEIERLRETYGFAEAVTREWAGRLSGAGLRRLTETRSADGRIVWELYEVTPG